jgi:hypothetical protein
MGHWFEQAGITTPFTYASVSLYPEHHTEFTDNLNRAFLLSQGPGVQVQAPGPDSGLGKVSSA